MSAAMDGTGFALGSVPLAPPDSIFHLTASYKADSNPQKINLGVGAYRDDAGKPWVLPVVKKAEILVVQNPALDHEYLPIDGLPAFTAASAKLILGEGSKAIAQGRVTGCQSISGTGAVRIGADLLARFHPGTTVYITNPTWANHRAIFEAAGVRVAEIPYWDAASKGLGFQEHLATIQAAPEGSVFLIHACAHNPTGVDPSQAQWREIAATMKERKHFPFFDCAYQGFASGDLDTDAWAVRHFVDQGFELLVAQSYAKNFGLYGERAGCLTVVAASKDAAAAANSQLCKINRTMISNPPAFGARVVSTILTTPALYAEWKVQLKLMADRIIAMRQALFAALQRLGTPGQWTHVVEQIGMFSFTGISKAQVACLKSKYSVYMTDNGRISMAGLNTGNVETFAQALDWVVRNIPE